MRVWTGLLVLTMACSGDEGDDGTTDAPGTTNGGCSDPAVNPWAGTCAEAYWLGCFDPSGECTGTFDMSGNVELVWANGAMVETELDLSSPMDPVALTTLTASDGTVCVTGESENMADGCPSLTTYTRASDGQQMTYCASMTGDLTATCPDGTEITVTAAESQAAQGCEYGGGEPCTMTGPGM